jgi:hypothetical protein
MVHSGFEATAVVDAVRKPWKLTALTLNGIKTEGPMAAEVPLDRQRPAEFVFSRHVAEKLAAIEKAEPGAHKLDATQ